MSPSYGHHEERECARCFGVFRVVRASPLTVCPPCEAWLDGQGRGDQAVEGVAFFLHEQQFVLRRRMLHGIARRAAARRARK